MRESGQVESQEADMDAEPRWLIPDRVGIRLSLVLFGVPYRPTFFVFFQMCLCPVRQSLGLNAANSSGLE